MSAKFHFINHACFILEKNNSAIIFDPYLDDNPEGLTAKDIKVDYIFVSHGHFDHLGSAFEIAKNCDATIISTAEICGLAQDAGRPVLKGGIMMGDKGADSHHLRLKAVHKFQVLRYMGRGLIR